MAHNQTAEALQLLEAGLTELIESGDWKSFLKIQSKFHSYSFNNVLLILSQCRDATRVAGYQKWQEMGRQVTKGSKAIKILAPLKRKVEKENGDLESRVSIFGFRTVNVFDISQTEGEELLNQLIAFSHHNKVPVHFKGASGANGYCRYNAKTGEPIEIVVDPLLSPLHQATTLVHEIGHSLLHCPKEYEKHIADSLAELEAESVAFVVLQHFGLASGAYSFSYTLGWQETENALENLKKSGSRIQKAASQVIDWVEKHSDSAEQSVTELAA